MTAKEAMDKVIQSLDLCVNKIEKINDTLRPHVPICNECHVILTRDEIQERVDNGLNVLGEDIVCDKCYMEWQKQKFEETRHPDEGRDL